jgi:fatty acid desaturase
MKKLMLMVGLSIPLVLGNLAVLVPSIIFLLAGFFLTFVGPFLLIDAILGLAAMMSVILFGIALGHSPTTSLVQGLLVGL